jgi:hypothetical protein
MAGAHKMEGYKALSCEPVSVSTKYKSLNNALELIQA